MLSVGVGVGVGVEEEEENMKPVTQTFRASYLCTFNVATIFLGSSLHMVYYHIA